MSDEDHNTPDDSPEDLPPAQDVKAHEVTRARNDEFSGKIETLINDAEAMRLSFMKRHRTREHITTTLGLLSLMAGAAGFGWFLLVDADIIRAIGAMTLAILLPALLNVWKASILKAYERSYKREFLPRLARALGGFKFHPSRGISSKIIARTGLIPKHDVYNAEDCFMGLYKGVKVLFSEARLLHKKTYLEPIFDGIFVLLEIPSAAIEGHTILTADKNMVREWRSTRWRKLQDVNIKTDNPEWDRFSVFSDQPDAAKLLVGEKLLKELSEAADIFDNAPLSAAMFKGKFIFLMIPYSGDMFEASNINIPVATKQHAMQCKREIEQILEIIDVFDLYQPANVSGAPGKSAAHPDEAPEQD